MAINPTNLEEARDALKKEMDESGLDFKNLSSNLDSAAGLNNESSVSPESTTSGPSGPSGP